MPQKILKIIEPSKWGYLLQNYGQFFNRICFKATLFYYIAHWHEQEFSVYPILPFNILLRKWRKKSTFGLPSVNYQVQGAWNLSVQLFFGNQCVNFLKVIFKVSIRKSVKISWYHFGCIEAVACYLLAIHRFLAVPENPQKEMRLIIFLAQTVPITGQNGVPKINLWLRQSSLCVWCASLVCEGETKDPIAR